MAIGRQKHQARLDDDLQIVDRDEDAEPSLATLLLACAPCRAVIEERRDDERTLRFLEPVIATTAQPMLSEVDAGLSRSALDMVS
jgi:hypothetical protein